METSTYLTRPGPPASRTTGWATAGAIAFWVVAGGLATALLSFAALMSSSGDGLDSLNGASFVVPVVGLGLSLLVVPLATLLGAIAWIGAAQNGGRARLAIAATLLGTPSLLLWAGYLLGA